MTWIPCVKLITWTNKVGLYFVHLNQPKAQSMTATTSLKTHVWVQEHKENWSNNMIDAFFCLTSNKNIEFVAH